MVCRQLTWAGRQLTWAADCLCRLQTACSGSSHDLQMSSSETFSSVLVHVCVQVAGYCLFALLAHDNDESYLFQRCYHKPVGSVGQVVSFPGNITGLGMRQGSPPPSWYTVCLKIGRQF